MAFDEIGVLNWAKLLFHMFWDEASIRKSLHFGPPFQLTFKTSDCTHTQINRLNIISLFKCQKPDKSY